MATGYRPEVIQRAFVDFIGTRLYPFWSLTLPKLRLIARRALSDDLVALQFETNRAFKQQVFGLQNGWQGGQHVNLKVLIEGVYHQRSYSLVGLPNQILWWQDATINNEDNKSQKQLPQTITIAIKPQGLVSNYLTQHAALGTIFDSSVPSGDFTLAQALLTKPATLSAVKLAPLLFIAGGSGITPMLGLITQALQRGHKVTLLHYNRTALLKDAFQTQWQQLAATYSTFTYHIINTADPSTYLGASRHLSAPSLLALALPLADTQIFACGSQALLAGLYRVAAEITLQQDHLFDNNHSLHNNIVIENFGKILPNVDNAQIHDNTDNTAAQTVYLRSRQRQFSSSSTLLVSAEAAGIRLSYGCRQGICQLCRCNKISGIVKNIQTGKISSDGYESIQTCINVAMTDVVIDI